MAKAKETVEKKEETKKKKSTKRTHNVFFSLYKLRRLTSKFFFLYLLET